MWAQLREYKVPCAGISLFTFQIGRNYTSVSTFTLITVSPPRVWSAETAQSIEELITVSPPKRGSFLCLPLLPSLAHGPAASLVPLWVRCLSDPSTGCISLLSQQKTKPVKKKKADLLGQWMLGQEQQGNRTLQPGSGQGGGRTGHFRGARSACCLAEPCAWRAVLLHLQQRQAACLLWVENPHSDKISNYCLLLKLNGTNSGSCTVDFF